MHYEQVVDDYASGKIDRDEWILVIDNDGGYWQYDGPVLNDEDIDHLVSRMDEKYGTPDDYNDVVDILKAVGVKAEWV